MTIYYTDRFGGRKGESHELLKRAIALHIGDEAKAGALVGGMQRGAQGKPYIDGFCGFSISHSNDAWAVLFCENECGLDIQFSRKCDILSISGRCFDAADAAAIRSACEESEEKGRDVFFRIWSRREALAKAMGGSAFDSGLSSVSGDKAEAGGKEYALKDIALPGLPELYAAVCVESVTADADEEVCIIFRKLPDDTHDRLYAEQK